MENRLEIIERIKVFFHLQISELPEKEIVNLYYQMEEARYRAFSKMDVGSDLPLKEESEIVRFQQQVMKRLLTRIKSPDVKLRAQTKGLDTAKIFWQELIERSRRHQSNESNLILYAEGRITEIQNKRQSLMQ